MFEQIKQFLFEYDLQKIQEVLRTMDWGKVASTPEVWFVSIPVLGIMVWKRKFRLMLFLASVVAFLFVLPYAMPAPGEAVPLAKLLTFMGYSLALVLINLYFLFVRRD